MSDWQNPRTEWWRYGKDFLVTVKHQKLPPETGDYINHEDGRNRWCVYAYIYRGHPLFDMVEPHGHMWQKAFENMPMHGGPSLFLTHYAAENFITSYQVGADYNHLHDSYYTNLEVTSPESIMRDADALFKYLSGEVDVDSE